MTGHHLGITIHIPGTLTEMVNFYWKVPFQCHLTRVSAVTAGIDPQQEGLLTVLAGPTSTAFLLQTVPIGTNGTPLEYEFPKTTQNNESRPTGLINENDKLRVVFQHDYAGLAAEDVTIVLTLEEG